MQGFLLVDKPAGVTSHDVVQRVRRLSGVRRVGHAGTLDPMATGLLPVAIGDATRLMEFLADREKGYLAHMRLGEQTDTQDAEGEVLASLPWNTIDVSSLQSVLSQFRGRIEQLPPMYSALKRNGVPLYKLARQGLEVERAARQVDIFNLDLLRFEPPTVELSVLCSKGTYIRTLCHDIGLQLGCGAHMTSLRRFRHGRFDLSQSVSLADAEAVGRAGLSALLLSPLDALSDLPLAQAGDVARARLANGVPPQQVDVDFSDGDCAPGTLVRLAFQGQLLSVARFAPGRENESRGDFELLKVFHPAADNTG
jgi:tRNA pseudouridine55 synthase